MTTPNGPILFNSSTGSDSLASGLGPSTSVYGTNASFTGTTVTLDGSPDLSGVTAGHLLYIVTSSGRKFTPISAVDNTAKTVTIDHSLGGTSTGLTWAIGGKRQTLAGSLQLFSDVLSDWIIELADGYTETLSSALQIGYGGSTTNPTILRGESGAASKPILTFSNNGYGIQFTYASQSWILEGFELRNTNATKTASIAVYENLATGFILIRNITINHATDKFGVGVYSDSGGDTILTVRSCSVANCASHGVQVASSSAVFKAYDSSVYNNGGRGFYISGSFVKGYIINRCLVYGNVSYGIDVASVDTTIYDCSISNCIVYGNGAAGINLTDRTGIRVVENIISSNGGYGLVKSANGSFYADYNAYYSNTSGEVSGVNNGEHDITLTANPFVDAANGDFNLNRVTGGGLALRQAPVVLP